MLVGLDAAGAAALAVPLTDGYAVPAGTGAALVLLNALGGLYRGRPPGPWMDFGALTVRALVVAAVLGVLTPVRAPSELAPSRWLVCAALFMAWPTLVRMIVNRLARLRRAGGAPSAVIVGTGAMSDYLLWALRRRPELGLAPLGRLEAGDGGTADDVPVLGGPRDLRRVVEAHGVDTVVLVLDEMEREHVEPSVRVCLEAGCRTLVIPPTAVGGSTGSRQLAGLPCQPVHRRPYGWSSRQVKRAFDAVVALVLLALVWPVLAVCAYALRRETGPGVIFRQTRIGVDGTPFTLLKFRTLRPDDQAESDTRWSVHNDDRIGPVGEFLRRTSLDELPQLVNVVRGDMSLVGPRPERPHFVQRFSRTCSGYALRHRVPTGMTGWAQVHGLRGDTSIEMRARFDNHYIDQWSFVRDLNILLRTCRAMVTRS